MLLCRFSLNIQSIWRWTHGMTSVKTQSAGHIPMKVFAGMHLRSWHLPPSTACHFSHTRLLLLSARQVSPHLSQSPKYQRAQHVPVISSSLRSCPHWSIGHFTAMSYYATVSGNCGSCAECLFRNRLRDPRLLIHHHLLTSNEVWQILGIASACLATLNYP